MPRVSWATSNEPLVAPKPAPRHAYAVLDPGQFEARYGSRCSECAEFIRKGEPAGYNESDEIVCDDCWIPYSDR